MKILTKLRVIVLMPILLLLALGGIMGIASRALGVADESERAADAVISGVSELNVLTYEYIHHRGTRARQQWEGKHASLGELLAAAAATDSADRDIWLRARRYHGEIGALFVEIVGRSLDEADGGTMIGADDYEQRLAGQLLTKSYSLVSLATQLASANTAARKRVREWSMPLVVLSVLVMGCMLAGISYVIAGNITKPIARFYEGTEYVGRGRLDYRIDNQADDEIGQLSRAFDHMTEKLRTVTVSHERLETEVGERKRAEDDLAASAEELREKNSELENDLAMARQIQMAFLPRRYPSFPRGSTPEESVLNFCHRYYPSEKVGGDFFAVLPLADMRAGVLICDVMGHGMRAALVTAILRGLVVESTAEAHDPGAFLTKLNVGLMTIFHRDDDLLFASALYVVVDASTGLMRYANAGHPDPLHLHRQAGEVEAMVLEDTGPGPALGIVEGCVYTTHETPLAERDAVLLFTDGVFEACSDDLEEYGKDRLLAAARARIELPVPQLLDELMNDVQEFAHEGFGDDVCLVAAEVARLTTSV